jgi:hypothetical protein
MAATKKTWRTRRYLTVNSDYFRLRYAPPVSDWDTDFASEYSTFVKNVDELEKKIKATIRHLKKKRSETPHRFYIDAPDLSEEEIREIDLRTSPTGQPTLVEMCGDEEEDKKRLAGMQHSLICWRDWRNPLSLWQKKLPSVGPPWLGARTPSSQYDMFKEASSVYSE